MWSEAGVDSRQCPQTFAQNMIAEQPNIIPTALYEVGAASKALRISYQTLYRYTKAGICKASLRKSNGRMVWSGNELIKCWRTVK